MNLIWIFKDPNPKECYETLNTNGLMVIWYSVHPYTIFSLKNRAFYMMYLKATIELGMEQSDGLCLGFCDLMALGL